MGVFEDLYIKMRSGVSKIGDKTNKLLSISKLKIEMAERNNSISEKYRLIGKYVYDMYRNGNVFDVEDVTDWIEEINTLKSHIKDCEEKISQVQEKELCSYCRSKNEAGSKYCSNCGKSIGYEPRKSFDSSNSDNDHLN